MLTHRQACPSPAGLRLTDGEARKLGRNIYAAFHLDMSDQHFVRTTLGGIDPRPHRMLERLQLEEKFRRVLQRPCYWWYPKTNKERLVEGLIVETEECVKEYNQSFRGRPS